MKIWQIVLWTLGIGLVACDRAKMEKPAAGYTERMYERGGNGTDFKVPLLPGYEWQITQSWGDHCEQCDGLYPEDEVSYCDDSHMLSANYYGWDFSLPGDSDSGKEILASAEGHVKEIGYGATGWGNYVILDHGNNVCTRYSHMLNPSPLSQGQAVCQGLVVGSIGGTPNWSPHLHFQFEECDTEDSIPMGFTDGNAVPMCRKLNAYHDDIHDQQGHYLALQLTNQKRVNCNAAANPAGDAELDENGWVGAACGGIQGCPLNQNCNHGYNHQFSDANNLSDGVKAAANYLYAECAVDGFADGTVRGADRITRAEALKIPMTLFNLVNANCGASAIPYSDVANGAWYRSVVACALRNTVINSGVRFQPNTRVNIAEAVKMAVLTGVRAGKIHLVNSNVQHFRNIPSNHWAYQYMETLYSYGATINLDLDPARTVQRGEFMSMVAALSPCFCANVDCDGSCQCSQSNYSCTDPNNNGAGTGGAAPAQPAAVSNPFGVTVSCFTKPNFQQCNGQNYNYVIACSVNNGGNQPVYVNHLTMHINNADDSGACSFPNPTTNANGVGTQLVNPGQRVNLTGGLDLLCGREPADGRLGVNIDLTERHGGVATVYANAAAADIQLERGMVASCQHGPAPASQAPAPVTEPPAPPATLAHRNADGTCNFNGLYTLQLFSQGGTVEILTATGEYVNQPMYNNQWMVVQVACNELPTAILVHGGPDGAWVSTDPATQGAAQPLEVNFWAPYVGGITTHPRIAATGHVRHLSFGVNASRGLLLGIGF